jgi:hypothetical protein
MWLQLAQLSFAGAPSGARDGHPHDTGKAQAAACQRDTASSDCPVEAA